jgi:hypothetical protein
MGVPITSRNSTAILDITLIGMGMVYTGKNVE